MSENDCGRGYVSVSKSVRTSVPGRASERVIHGNYLYGNLLTKSLLLRRFF